LFFRALTSPRAGRLWLSCASSLVASKLGFIPGCVYLLSTWYPHFELQKRNAVSYLIGNMASAFASILPYGLMRLNGHAGLTGRRWIFIVSAFLIHASLYTTEMVY
jgi:hypothetical protein